METLNAPRRFGQDITNLKKLNLTLVKKKYDYNPSSSSMRYKSQREMSVKLAKKRAGSHYMYSKNNNLSISQDSTVIKCNELMVENGKKQMISQIDQMYKHNPQYVAQYSYDIQEYLKQIEDRTLPDTSYKQQQITPKMRAILIDWIIEVIFKFRMRQETLFLVINLIDRYLSLQQANRNNFQLIGVAAIFIATKAEEVKCIRARDLSQITDKAFSPQDILQQESMILSSLQFNITGPTIYSFLVRLQTICSISQKHFQLCNLLIESHLLLNVQEHKSSYLAACAFYCVRKIKRYNPVWPLPLQSVSESKEEELKKQAKFMFNQLNTTSFNSLKMKYPKLI